MKRKLTAVFVIFLLYIQVLLPDSIVFAAQTLYNNATGTEDGYNYELWKDYGTTSMTLNGGGAFSCSWSNIGNALFRKGIKWDCTKTYQQIGNISIDFGCNYQPNGNSYLCVYGWSRNPLVEYYIVESWGTWRPPGASSKGTITVDGGTYDVYETDRINQPSIDGNTTFKQYWSVRTSKRTSGTISVTEHFKAWENMGMRLGNLYEAALNVEGYQSSGSANVYQNNITVGGSSSSTSAPSYTQNPGTSTGSGSKIECENMTLSGQYAGKISSPFSGVALYANNDAVSTTVNFTTATHDFTLRGCSNNSNMAKVDLVIGGQTKGTFYYGDSYTAEYTIKDVYTGTGNQEVKLVVTADDGQWDAYIDCLTIGGVSSNNNNNTQQGLNSSTKMVALTFDDGPSSTTSQVLDILQQNNAVATFFLVGQNVNSNTKSIMQRQISMGCELACHSNTHSDMGNMSAWEVQNEINQCVNAIKSNVTTEIKFFRAPYLSTSNTMFQNIDLNFIQGISCNDWESSCSAEQRKNTVLNSVSDGSIVLLHDFQGNTNTVQALPGIIQGLKSRGYTLVTVSDLFKYKNVNPNVEYKVWSNVYN